MESRSFIRNVSCLYLMLCILLLAACDAPARGKAKETPTTLSASTSTPTPPHAEWHNIPGVPQNEPNIVFAPSAPNTGFACGGSPIAESTTPTFFKSTNTGKTWQAQTHAPLPKMPCDVFVDASDANDIFLQHVLQNTLGSDPISATLWRSRDGGATWKQLTLLPHTFGWGQLAVVGTRLIVRASFTDEPVDCPPPGSTQLPRHPNQLYVSDDGGTTWQPFAQSIALQKLAMHEFYAVGDTLFVPAETIAPLCTPTTPSLWKSTDQGHTWARVALPAAMQWFSIACFTPSATGAGFYAVAVVGYAAQPNAQSLIYSADSGVTWTSLPAFPGSQSSANISFQPVVVAPDGTALVEAYDSSKGQQGDLGISFLRPSDPTTAWQPYAPGFGGSWQVLHGTIYGDVIMAGTLAYLPLP
ncbi:MAG: hypothetical protein OJF49_003926 [Ktedonobacterales bacterium]|jgi:hypothetical protein|nr:MAG: hypothetical protein OJF49_003926 [Ktedonobacterales bacterium]